MTLQEFDANLKASFPGLVYELAASTKAERFAAWHRYGRSSTYGDNVNQIDAPKVQIDIVSGDPNDPLFDGIAGALRRMDLPYFVASEGYDDDYVAYRTILQLVVI